MTCRNFLCTLNLDEKDGWEDKLKHIYEETKATYCVGQLEKGNETEHLHIQFFLNFKLAARIARITKVDKRIHVEKVKVNNGADKYCMKEDTRVAGPLEFGIKPVEVNKKVDWEMVWKTAKEGNLEKIPASIRVIHYNKLKQIAKDNLELKDCNHLRGIWIYGPAGAGKSRWVREHCKPLYPKLCNKWWDGYQGEPYVVMDDVMPEHKVLSQQFKIWSDRYDCILETKGGAVHSQYEWFIVTSQYCIDEVFTEDRDRDAIHRRFQEYEISSIEGLKLELVGATRDSPCGYNTQDHGESGQ